MEVRILTEVNEFHAFSSTYFSNGDLGVSGNHVHHPDHVLILCVSDWSVSGGNNVIDVYRFDTKTVETWVANPTDEYKVYDTLEFKC